MPQDRESGDAARLFGLRCGKLVAEHLGAVTVRKGSNEAVLHGDRVVIKCAQRANGNVKVLVTMLERVQRVFGVFEVSPGLYGLWILDSEMYKELMKIQAARPKAAAQGMVSYSQFREHGRAAGTVSLPPAE